MNGSDFGPDSNLLWYKELRIHCFELKQEDGEFMSEGVRNSGGDPRSLAHDLRTPLTSLKSCLDLLLAGEAGPLTSDQKRFLDVALRNLDRLDSLVDDIMTSSLNGPEGGCRGQDMDLGPILREAVALHAAAAGRAHQTIDTSGLPASFIACAEPAGIVRMVDNILGNAIRHGGRGALIRVWLEPRPKPDPGLALQLARHCFLPFNFFNLVIEDSGPGLPPEYLTGREAPKSQGNHGMGLRITADLAAARGGGLRLASQPGGGTTAWIRLPMDPDTAHLQRVACELERRLESGEHLALLDLREGPGEAAIHAGRVEAFLADVESACPGGGIELAHGLWVAVVKARVDWTERWTAFAGAIGGRLDETDWEFPDLGATEATQTPNSQESFNPTAGGPITNG